MRKLDSGGFGEVFLARFRGFDTVAVKYILTNNGKASSAKAKREFELELNVMRDLRHRNIVQVGVACFLSQNVERTALSYHEILGTAGDWLEFA